VPAPERLQPFLARHLAATSRAGLPGLRLISWPRSFSLPPRRIQSPSPELHTHRQVCARALLRCAAAILRRRPTWSRRGFLAVASRFPSARALEVADGDIVPSVKKRDRLGLVGRGPVIPLALLCGRTPPRHTAHQLERHFCCSGKTTTASRIIRPNLSQDHTFLQTRGWSLLVVQYAYLSRVYLPPVCAGKEGQRPNLKKAQRTRLAPSCLVHRLSVPPAIRLFPTPPSRPDKPALSQRRSHS
jgi:hypothetical protein